MLTKSLRNRAPFSLAACASPVATPAGRLPSALESAIAEAFGAAVSTIQLDAITLSLAASTKSFVSQLMMGVPTHSHRRY